jgi:hypothetical protein
MGDYSPSTLLPILTMKTFDSNELPAGGIYRKLAETQAILILTQNDLGQEIENGNDHIGLNVYRRALDSAMDLIVPCLDSLKKLDCIDKEIESPPTSEIAKIYTTASEIMMTLYSFECVLKCAWESLPESDGRETVRLMSELISKEAEKIEMKVCNPLKKFDA